MTPLETLERMRTERHCLETCACGAPAACLEPSCTTRRDECEALSYAINLASQLLEAEHAFQAMTDVILARELVLANGAFGHG